MADNDDLTLKIGFEPDLQSLQKAAEQGAKQYSKAFRNHLENFISLRNMQAYVDYTTGYPNTAKGSDIYNNINSVYTKLFNTLIKYMGSVEKFSKALYRFEESAHYRHTLVGGPRNGQFGEVNWVPGHYPMPWANYQAALPNDYQQPLLLGYNPKSYNTFKGMRYFPALENIPNEYNDFIHKLRNSERYSNSVSSSRMQDISNLDVMRKGFYYSKTWNNDLYGAAMTDEAPAYYKLKATQFIKDREYREQMGNILTAWGGSEGFFDMPAASTWKYHPLFAHGKGGLARHTEAVMQGVYQDAVKAGFSPEDTDKLLAASMLHDTLKYQSGRPNATHAKDMAFVLEQLGYEDEASWVRTHMGEVKSGYGKGHGPEAGNPYQKILADTDFLVSRQYAQYAVNWRNGTFTPDMDKLREMAVERGEGRWIDPKKEHNAANWERIVKDQKELNKDSKGWLENLRNVAGVLAVIHAIKKGVKAVQNFDAAAGAGIKEAAESLPNRRYYAGYDTYEAMQNKTAASSIGISDSAINSDVTQFSANRGQMSLLGQGFNLLPVSILGQWQNMMNAGNANDAWWNTLEAVAKRYEAASQKEREQLQELLDKTLGKSATELLAYARNNNKTIEEIRTLRDNPNYSAYEETESINYDLSKVESSIKASYQKIYQDWEKTFGIPFKEFWDNLLITFTTNKTFQKIVGEHTGNSVWAMASTLLTPYTLTVDRLFSLGAATPYAAKDPYTVLKKAGIEGLNKLRDTYWKDRQEVYNLPSNLPAPLMQGALDDILLYKQAMLKLHDYGLDEDTSTISTLQSLMTYSPDDAEQDKAARNFAEVLFDTINAGNKSKKSHEEIQADLQRELGLFVAGLKYTDIMRNPNLTATDKNEFIVGHLKIDINHDYSKDTSETIRVDGKIAGEGWTTVEIPVNAIPGNK